MRRIGFLTFSILILIGLSAGSSAHAALCPTASPQGVGCPSEPSQQYYCNGSCRTGQAQCPSWTPSPICASGFGCTNFATADLCGYGATCSAGYTLCGAWPNFTCISTVSPVSPCSTYDTCNNYCTGCISGYSLCSSTHTCVSNPGCLPGQTFNACTSSCEGSVSMLKLGYDSVSGTAVVQSATYPALYIPSSSFVGIGTSTPAAKLEVVSASGNASILAGLKRIGNVDLPFDVTDAATKGYVDSVSASSSSLWGGATVGNIWSLNSGNVGIGTTTPTSKLHVVGDTYLNGNATSTGYLTITSTGISSGNIRFTTANPYITASSYLVMPGGLYVSGAGIAYFGIVRARGIVSNDTGPYLTIAGGTSTATYISGTLGIGTNSPAAKLEVVSSTGNTSILAGLKRISNVDLPFAATDAATKGYIDALLSTSTPIAGAYLPLSGGTMIASSSINMNDGNITNLFDLEITNKLTVSTIDPLYRIGGVNYSTYAASISGGVKEEYIGKIMISKKNRISGEFEAIIDFSKIEEGSDLWVWRRVVDFNNNNVDVLITPYGRFAAVYYLIDGEKLVFRSDYPVEVSYRLVGRRFDWRQWPTRATDQNGRGLEIK
ncbi:MAG: hypothetical protein WC458_02635 [Patescibacteria group bacterium]